MVTEQQQVRVPVSHEEVRLEREPITDANADDAPSIRTEFIEADGGAAAASCRAGERSGMVVSTIATSNGMFHLLVAGEIDISTVDDLKAALTHAITADAATAVVADLARLTFCDSSGIAALDKAYHQASKRGVTFRVRNVQPPVRRVLEITGVLARLLGQ
ncbi:anti-sigma factor antagonist [Paractinoplanes toevensis]|uniref:anti-sigma factor antagonist n=1 Tax=Paractinoplanes toevensis TaxID=571911 RepID=UPI001FE8BE94|nr:anti-sigma factor antagonist [Actinoplanes toevensis]